MNPFRFPFAMVGLFGLIAVVPAWVWFVHSYPAVEDLPIQVKFLLDLTLPATIGLFIASWIQPRG